MLHHLIGSSSLWYWFHAVQESLCAGFPWCEWPLLTLDDALPNSGTLMLSLLWLKCFVLFYSFMQNNQMSHHYQALVTRILSNNEITIFAPKRGHILRFDYLHWSTITSEPNHYWCWASTKRYRRISVKWISLLSLTVSWVPSIQTTIIWVEGWSLHGC